MNAGIISNISMELLLVPEAASEHELLELPLPSSPGGGGRESPGGGVRDEGVMAIPHTPPVPTGRPPGSTTMLVAVSISKTPPPSTAT